MREDAVIIEDLSVSFGGRPVLHSVNARFPQSGASVLVGRSGSGKTTLLRSINRLNEEFPGCATSGRVMVNFSAGAVDIYEKAAPPLRELRLRSGMLFQTPYMFPVSVYRNMAMPLQLARGYGKSELGDRIRATLELVGLWIPPKSQIYPQTGVSSNSSISISRYTLSLSSCVIPRYRRVISKEEWLYISISITGRTPAFHAKYPKVFLSE